ncbi:MAG: hypothetical protein COS89_06030 [Deltaproteobacteria bacterium CG07_land_8_20_14_0_80_38_7]|nr:MAG: hypothetical protein COS89_06030 [Deltaproteobacteria bacterium CG07_land_8_20_14_0_80_38_7]
MKTIIDHIVFYPTYFSLILLGFFVHKRKARPVTVKGPKNSSYMEISDHYGRVVRLNWKHLMVLKTQWKGRIRRYLNVTFRKSYVEKQMKKRVGECKMCGRCCCERKCPFIIKENNTWKCILHPTKPSNCLVYPIDQKDILEYSCPGFSFLTNTKQERLHDEYYTAN